MDIFDLTPLTLDVDKDRRIVFKTFDLNRRHFYIGLAAGMPAFMVMVFLWVWIHAAAILPAALVFATPFYLVEMRSAEGLKLRKYQAMMDARTANVGKFMVCGQEIHPATFRPRVVHTVALPIATYDKPNQGVDVSSTFST